MDPLASVSEALAKINTRLDSIESRLGGAGAGAGAGAAAPALPPKKTKKKKKTPPPKPDPVLTFIAPRKLWKVENHDHNNSVEIGEDVDRQHKVRISKCQFSTITIPAKCTSVTIENCKKVNVLIEGVIASVEIFHCKGCKVQVKTKAPTVTLDDVQGFTLFLPFEGRSCKIVSSNISDTNVAFPDGAGDEADWIEKPVPEQYVSVIQDDNTVKTSVSEIYG